MCDSFDIRRVVFPIDTLGEENIDEAQKLRRHCIGVANAALHRMGYKYAAAVADGERQGIHAQAFGNAVFDAVTAGLQGEAAIDRVLEGFYPEGTGRAKAKKAEAVKVAHPRFSVATERLMRYPHPLGGIPSPFYEAMMKWAAAHRAVNSLHSQDGCSVDEALAMVSDFERSVDDLYGIAREGV